MNYELVRWMPPEVLSRPTRPKFSKFSDVWSFGVTCWEIYSFALDPYYVVPSNPEVIAFVMGGGRLEKPSNCHPGVWRVIGSCWNKQPSSRPSFEQLMDDILHATNPLKQKNVPQVDVYIT
jgi:serine/threonine protein kinase